MKFTRIKAKNNEWFSDVCLSLEKAGFRFNTTNKLRTGHVIKNIRIDPEALGYNFDTRGGRRCRYLTWEQWVVVNQIINYRMDVHKVTGKVVSLGGLFVIRDLDGAKTEDDWAEHEHDNTGSQFRPAYRVNYIIPLSERI